MLSRRLPVLLLIFGFALPGVASADEPVWTARKKNHWAWKSPGRPEVPAVRDAVWVNNPIDAFVLAKLEEAGLHPAPPATPEQLLRRVTFDLTGLPPTPQDIANFDLRIQDLRRGASGQADVADSRSAIPQLAIAEVVDRLLASPHYGERWGRHWLDLARFAESNGFEHDEVRPDAWRYRDYVIAAFNADLPYDRFVREQIAGDEIAPGDPAALVATGFHLLGPDMTDNASQEQRRYDTLCDMTDTTGLVFLGLTVGCARCHNHRFEPISQHDYFRLQSFFTPAEFRRDLPVADAARKAAFDKQMKEYQRLTRPTQDALKELEEPYRRKLYAAKLAKLAEPVQAAHHTPEQRRTAAQKELVKKTARFLTVQAKDLTSAMTIEDRTRQERLLAELKKLDARKPAPLPTAMGLRDRDREAATFVLHRGELSNPGDEVRPAWLSILSPGFVAAPADVRPRPDSTGRRAALAEWLTRPDHPLTARVIVNRLWQHHFGRGIVPTPSDFGLNGEPPTHPELLDWLAAEFVRQGWSLKKLHRLMLLSSAYRQSTVNAEAQAADPQNRLFGRMNRLRLEGEVLRDSLLAVSGRLNTRVGGPGVFPPLPPDARAGAKEWKASADPADHFRRSVYIFARRNLRFPFLEPFDVPDTNQSCPQRERSTTAPQALALLNADDVLAAARALATRLEAEADDADGRVTLAYRLTLGREPSAEERQVAREFLADSPFSEFCRALFNLNEFVYLD